jgi:2-methylcitrate dehydratase
MLLPADYAEDETALFHPVTRRLMEKIDFRHGGPEYDRRYPDGIPTTVEMEHAGLGNLTSGLVIYPEGHARCASSEWLALLDHKWRMLVRPAIGGYDCFIHGLTNVVAKSPKQVVAMYDFQILTLAE